MKPIVKICLAASGVLFLLGVLCIGAGAAMGMTPARLLASGHYPGSSFLRQRLRPEAVQPLEELEDRLEYEMEFPADDGLSDLPSLSGSNASDAEEYYEFRDVRELDLDLNLCVLTIYQHENDWITLEADNTRNFFRCTQNGDALLVEDKRSASTNQNSINQALRLTLYLPAQGCTELSAELGVSEVTIDRLTVDDLEIHSGVGSITAGTISGKEISLATDVGTLSADCIRSEGETELEVGTGDLTIAQFDGSSLELDCGLGNAEVTAAGRELDYNYTLDAGFGRICLNHQLYGSGHHDDSHHDNEHHMDIHHDADRHISMNCGMGNATLNFMEE